MEINGRTKTYLIPTLTALLGILLGSIVLPAARDRLALEGRQVKVETRLESAEREIDALRTDQKQFRPAAEMVSKDEFKGVLDRLERMEKKLDLLLEKRK